MDSRTRVERTSDRELTASRTVQAPARLVFEAFARPELFRQWWIPQSMGLTLVSCEMDVRTGGGYRLEISHPAAPEPMAFFGRYIEVVPPSRIVWTNEEGEEGAVTTVTLEEADGATRVVVRDLYPSREALDAAMASGATGAWPEQFEALEALLADPGAAI
ncbi:MAG: SRPBCC domain-containing protein [Brevundimonas sp.]|uniref:SRPBCC domain-containing protein n=1 Tax=Brevundimonas sp. TaxID=1871086 RepID=UPI0025BAAD92|nr:SRPBCC domain-containing protein [Brevundimonas sp.]MBX3478147.1 SRPBCC domain-containing protein [Brevundimonas sp.]